MNKQLISHIVVALAMLSLCQGLYAGVADNLEAYWKLDETSGATAVDSSAGGLYDGAISGGITQNQAGIIGTAYDFDSATDGVITIGSAPTITQQFTVSAWVRPETINTGTTASSRITVFGDLQTNLCLMIGYASTTAGPCEVVGYDNQTTSRTSALVYPNNWYHLAYSRNAETVNIYVDGVLVLSQATGTADSPINDMMIGRYSSQTARDWDGQLDDLGLWSAEKSAEEIALIHGLGLFAGVALDSSSIDDVLTAFNAGSGNSAYAGGYTWNYASGLSATTIGESGGSVGTGDAWIALDASGNGVQIGAASLHPGDANGDGMVNLADLQILGDNWQSTTASWAMADFTGDGNVNLADLQILGDNWGYGVGSDLSFDEALAGVVIPEPAAFGLLGLGMVAILTRRR